MTYIPIYANEIVNISVNSAESMGYAIKGILAGIGSNSTAYPSANLAYYVPFVLRRKITVSSMSCINGATAAGNVDMGIYSFDGARITHTGNTAQAGTTVIQQISLSGGAVTIGPGIYYMALVESSTSATFAMWTGLSATTLKACGMYQQATASPLPASATFATQAQTVLPMFGLTGIIN